MIQVTKFNGSHLYINADLIQYLEVTPDTIITLTNNTKIVVKEQPDEIINRIIEYRHRILIGPQTEAKE